MKFQNHMPRFGWGFSACFLAVCLAFTYLTARDGLAASAAKAGMQPLMMLALLTVFWMAGMALASYTLSKPCVLVEVLPDGTVHLAKHYLLSREQRLVGRDEPHEAKIVQDKDDEGNPYFFARITTADGWSVNLAESHDRTRCERALYRFTAAVEATTRHPAA